MALLLPAILLATAAPASARSDEDAVEAKRHYELGMARFNLREYKDAIVEFQAAYRIHPDPVFLYNLAQAYRLADDPDQAIYFYRAWLRARPDASNRREVEQRIAELRVQAAAKKSAAPPPAESAARPEKPVTPPEASAATVTSPPPPPDLAPKATPAAAPTLTVQRPVAPSSGHRGRTLEIAGLSVAGLGVAALAAGAAMAVLAKQAGDTLTSSTGVYDSGLDQRGHTYNSAGVALLAVGGAALVGGGVMALVGWRQQRAHHFALAPVVGPSQAGVHASLRF